MRQTIHLGDLKPGQSVQIRIGPFPPEVTLTALPITIRPCKPWWWEEGACYRLSPVGYESNQIQTMSPLNPFDVMGALWCFFRWRVPAEWRRRRRG
jgi:hypothetical protein